ncbi:MAG: urease accessory protein [Acidimicrobiaceae bacterium]|nr:urease accessory protein [Acidimicrobiaceae bacterium]
MNGGLEVRVEGTRVVRLVTAPPIAAKVLPGSFGPVVMLVGSAAGLLAGDRLRIRIDLAPGSRLEVRTTAATIAHPCLAGGATAIDVDCHVGAGAVLAWLPEPFIACAGCRHQGRVRLHLDKGARVVWLDTLTLGRTGETAGRVDQRLDVELEGRPLLREGLCLGGDSLDTGAGAAGDVPAVAGPAIAGPAIAGPALVGPAIAGTALVGTARTTPTAGTAIAGPAIAGPAIAGPTAGWDGPAVVGTHRHVAALHLLGRRMPAEIPGAMQLAGPGTTARFLAHRGDELARKVGAVLPLFLQVCSDPDDPLPGPAGERAKEAVHV